VHVTATCTGLFLFAGPAATRCDDPAYASLSGAWKGSYSILQRGSCTMGSAARLDATIQLTTDVKDDGTFTTTVGAIRYARDPSHLDAYSQFPAQGDPGTGRFMTDLTFFLKVPRRSACNGMVRRFETTYTGAVTEKKGRRRMEFTGIYEPCPEFDCKFQNVVKLEQVP
jgi:hypothetical protein